MVDHLHARLTIEGYALSRKGCVLYPSCPSSSAAAGQKSRRTKVILFFCWDISPARTTLKKIRVARHGSRLDVRETGATTSECSSCNYRLFDSSDSPVYLCCEPFGNPPLPPLGQTTRYFKSGQRKQMRAKQTDGNHFYGGGP